MYKKFFKRVLDILGSLILLPFVIIIICIFGPIIYFTDKGPFFYNGERMGKNGKLFKMFKLRSMHVNSKDIRNADGSTYNSDIDPRVTPIGRFLRKTSIDEFPQFLNVLIGDMSFVGPRPKLYNPDKYKNGIPKFYKKSFDVKPGITGYAQAYYRNSISNDEKFKLDAYYADNVTFFGDIKIILKTIKSVIYRENINSEQSRKQ